MFRYFFFLRKFKSFFKLRTKKIINPIQYPMHKKFNSTGVATNNKSLKHSRKNNKQKKKSNQQILISFQESVLCKAIYQTNNKNR